MLKKATSDAQSETSLVRNEGLLEMGFLLTMAMAIVTLLGIGAGDSMESRLQIFGVWMAGYGLSEVLRRSWKLNEAAWALAAGAWIASALAQWWSGGLKSSMLGGDVMVIMMAASVGSRGLVGLLALGSAISTYLMWRAGADAMLAAQLLGRSHSAAFLGHMGMLGMAAMCVVAAMRKQARMELVDEGQREKEAKSAENFMGLFLQSPAPMLISEEFAGGGSAKGKHKPRVVALNDSFESLFETGSKGRWGTPASPCDLWRHAEEFSGLAVKLVKSASISSEKCMMVSWGRKRKMVCLVSARRTLWKGVEAVLWTFQDVTETELLRSRLERQNEALAEKARATSMEARMDKLTNLPNRRYLEERMGMIDEMEERLPFCAMMIDVDCFKKYNDSLGHQEGDKCLAAIGGALAKVTAKLGEGVFAARYGGEEFAVTLLGYDQNAAMVAAWEVCDAISAMKIPHPNNSAGPYVTASIGVSERSSVGKAIEVLKKADDALYRSKEEGRARASWEPAE